MTQSSSDLWKPDLSRCQCLTVKALLLSLIAVVSGASGLPVRSLGQFLLTVRSHRRSCLLCTAQVHPSSWHLLTRLTTMQIRPFISSIAYLAFWLWGRLEPIPVVFCWRRGYIPDMLSANYGWTKKQATSQTHIHTEEQFQLSTSLMSYLYIVMEYPGWTPCRSSVNMQTTHVKTWYGTKPTSLSTARWRMQPPAIICPHLFLYISLDCILN